LQLARIGFGVITPMLIVCALFAPRLYERKPDCAVAPLSTPTFPSSAARVDTAPPAAALRQDEKNDGTAIDLYGNDVADAVAKYKLDATGSLYELHSPRTELPRLGSPKS
jgi:hypothetical protein